MTKIIKKEKTFSHPLEEVFEIEENTTIQEYHEVVSSNVIEHSSYDEKDNEIDKNLQQIYDIAITEFSAQIQAANDVDGKYRARNAEVAAQYLNTALNAMQVKANIKSNKDKLNKIPSALSGKNITNNLVVTDRNEILKILGKK